MQFKCGSFDVIDTQGKVYDSDHEMVAITEPTLAAVTYSKNNTKTSGDTSLERL